MRTCGRDVVQSVDRMGLTPQVLSLIWNPDEKSGQAVEARRFPPNHFV